MGYQITSSLGQHAQDSYKVSYGIDEGLKSVLSFDIAETDSLNWTNEWSRMSSTTVGQNAAYAITGPVAADAYSGPTEYEVWQDNIYGTFMFVAPGTIPLTPGSIAASPTYIQFNSTSVGSKSSPVTVSLKNMGSMSMYMGVTGIPFTTGSQAVSPVAAFSDSGFSIVPGKDACTGQILPPGGTCSLALQFAPTSTENLGNGGLVTGTMYTTGLTNAVVLGDTVYLAGMEATVTGHVAAPLANQSCAGPMGTTLNSPNILLSDSVTGASIYYTTDGTTPNTGSTQYLRPFSISSPTTLKAFATKSGQVDSPVISVQLSGSCISPL